MKKIVTLIFVLIVGIETILAWSGTCGTNVSWTLIDSVLTISGSGAMNDFKTNSTGEYRVPWEYYRNYIKSVQINSGVTSIGNYAFKSCDNLTSISISNSVTRIGDYAISECPITSITIPNSVVSIGEYAFYCCRYISSITIPNSVVSIGKKAFQSCHRLSSLTFGTGVTSLGEDLFAGCDSLTSIIVESGNTTYDSRDNCNAIINTASNKLIYGWKCTHIPNSVTCIGESAFKKCSGLSSITIPNSVTVIEDRAFQSCSNLVSVIMSDSVAYIGDWAFTQTNIWSITIPETIDSIGIGTFCYCKRLNSITWNARNCSDFTNLDSPFYRSDEPESDGRTRITSFTFGENVQHVPDYLCGRMYNLSSVTIPNSVTSIGSNAFADWNWYGSHTIYIPCGKMEWFQQMLPVVSDVIKYAPYPSYSITKIAEHGYITQTDTNYTVCDEPLFNCTAVPYYGFHFTQWSDGSTDNPRIITLTQDTTMEAIFALNTYNISVTCNIEQGSIEGESGDFDYLTEKTYKAIPKYGYQFVQWSDSVYVCDNGWDSNCWSGHWEKNADNPRMIVLTRDTAISAIFVPNTYTIVDNSDQTRGRINGVGSFDYLSHQEVTAIPVRGYQFVRWADGNTNNPRTIELTQDTTMEAIFDYQLTGKCGKDSALTWTLDTTTMALEITGQGALSENFYYGKFIESLTIGNEVTQIGRGAFYEFRNLKNVILGPSVKLLDEAAFAVTGIETITCYSQRPPTVNYRAFDAVDYSMIVYVPADYLEAYQMHDAWGLYDVRPIGAESTETTDVVVTPSETTAEVVWPAVTGAVTYEIVIKDKFGNVICTLIFNTNGQLTQIAFGAPAREQSAGFSFVVTGLEEGKSYDLTITAKNESGATLDEKTVSFSTGGAQGLEDVNATTNTRKVFHNGQILILRGEKVYTMTGQEVR